MDFQATIAEPLEHLLKSTGVTFIFSDNNVVEVNLHTRQVTQQAFDATLEYQFCRRDPNGNPVETEQASVAVRTDITRNELVVSIPGIEGTEALTAVQWNENIHVWQEDLVRFSRPITC